MEINFKDYLSEEEIKEIVKDEFRIKIRNEMNSEAETNRIISNLCYQFVWDMVDKQIEGSLEVILRDKIINIIKEMTDFCIFRKADAWDKKESLGQKILEQAIIDNSEIIKQKVKSYLKNLDENNNYIFGEAVKEAIITKIIA